MNNRDPVLFSNSVLALFAAIAIAALYWAFPGERLLSGLASKPVDIASLAYVRAAFNRAPGNQEVRLQLVEKLFEISNIQEAEQLLAPLLVAPGASVKAGEISIKIKFRRYFEIKDDIEKQALQLQLKTEILALFPKISIIPELDELADLAYQLGEPLVSAKIYRHIIEIKNQSQSKQESISMLKWLGIRNASAETSPQNTQYYIKKQLEALLAAQAGEEALKWADYYVRQYPQDTSILPIAIAIAQSQNDAIRARDWGRLLLAGKRDINKKQESAFACQKESRSDQVLWECENKHLVEQKIILKSVEFINFIKQLKLTDSPLGEQLQRELAANQLDNSLQWIRQELTVNPNTQETLQIAILLARTQGAMDLARQWNVKLLEMNPNDVQLIKQQIDFEMAVPDLPKALVYAQKWQQLAPEDIPAHLKLADISQWVSESEITLDEWVWLYRHTNQTDLLPKIISLATSIYKYEFLADLFAQIGRRRQLTDEEASTWFDTLQKSGLENAGSHYLTEYLSHWPKQQSVWEFLIKTLDGSDLIDEAIVRLKEMERNFGATTELRLKRVDYLIKLGQIKEAWELLSASKLIALPEDRIFWNKYANVAYLVGAENAMLTAYQENPQVGEDNSMLNYYFLNSLRDKQDSDDYEHFAVKIWQKSHQLSVLLDLIDFKMQHGKWDDAKLLLDLLNSKEDKVESSAHYWLIKAEVAGHFSDKATANRALRKALALEPDSASTRSLLIWHLVAAGEKNELKTMLIESETLAQTQSKLWESMAVGYRYLGESKYAVPWYEKALRRWPERHSLVLEYAQLLQETGQIENAKKLWRYLLNKLSVSGLVAMRTSPKAPASALERQYGEILRLYWGATASQQWLNWLQRHQDKPTHEFSEYRIAWFLAQQRFEQAKSVAAKIADTGKPLPVWQRLALATEANDVTAIATIMQNPEQLTPLDKINALRTRGEEQEALELATQLLGTEQKEEVLEALRQQVTDLSQVYPKGWAITAKSNNISELDILSYSADITYSKGHHGFWINYKDQYFNSKKNTLRLNGNQSHEQILNVEWKYHTLRYENRLKAGVNLREDKDFFTLENNFNYSLSPGWKAIFTGGYNILSNDSSVFRVAGLTDKIELRLSGEFSKREYFSVYGQGKQYKTRSGDSIGFGYGGGAEIGYRIRYEKPEWVIALYGNWKQADLDHDLPDDWRHLVPAGASMNSVLNASYKEIGLDLRLKEGDINPFGFTGRSFRYIIEGGLFLGQPTGNLGTKITAGIGTRLFTDDEISLSGHYSSVQGGAQSLPSTSIELRYSKRFD